MTELFYGSSAGTTDVHDVAGAPADAVRSFERGGGMSERDYVRFRELKMFMHHIYEFKKGVRNLVLCTMCPTCAALVAERLRGQRIDYLVQAVTDDKVNLYFGKRACLDAVRAFVDKPLNRLTPEQDFMLGAMLGYDIIQQCERFCRQRSRNAR